MIRVVVADDQALVRAGLAKLIEHQPDMDVVAEAGDGAEALTAARDLTPDVVLMDLRMPRMDGLEATRRMVLASPTTRVLVLTTFDLDEHVFDALQAGACGFVLKDCPPEELVAGIRGVVTGEVLLAPSITRRLVEEFVRRPRPGSAVPPALDVLTAREAEVLTLMARGLSNAEIAGRLVLSETTVKSHVARVLGKLGLRDRVQAVVLAYEQGLVRPGEHPGAPGERGSGGRQSLRG